MKLFRCSLAAAVFVAAAALLFSQRFDPPASRRPDDAVMKRIRDKENKLGEQLTSLYKQGLHDPVLAEVEVYLQAAARIDRLGEFYQPEAGRWTLEALDRGLLRASLAAEGGTPPWLLRRGHTVPRAYRSRIDGTAQPFAVTFPADYTRDRSRKYRIDVVLHGRDPALTEVKFLHEHDGDQAAPADQDAIRLDLYGRGNNGYRWAGEADIAEAFETFIAVERSLGRVDLLDPNRVVLRGFSMGGAGTWQTGLHYPSRWAVLGPGAGFVRTHGYAKEVPAQLPPYQEACLSIYDAIDYAENAFNVPVVAYGGADDPQLEAGRLMQERMKALNIPMRLLVAPGLGHRFPPEWQKKAEREYARHLAPGKGRSEYPRHVRFVTYTLKYPTCAWVEIVGLERHYAKARVDAETTRDGFAVRTENVQALRLTMPPASSPERQAVRIDGQAVEGRPVLVREGGLHLFLEKVDGTWKVVLPQKLVTSRLHRPQKMSRLQGPIDDAFTAPFLCVRGTGKKPWNEAVQKYAEAELERFQQAWDRYFRGELPVKEDTEVTEEDIGTHHLVLFGDPGSNSLLAQIVDALPLRWTPQQIVFGGKTYAAKDHVPVLIYPSPLNSDHLIVLNSGHTFHAADFRGTNALLYPRLGDYAVLKLTPTGNNAPVVEVETAGLFDEYWHLPKE
jgi:pimeloyl-ACP methyl ester carboxylesterase